MAEKKIVILFQGEDEFVTTLEKLRVVSVGAAQAAHTFSHLKGVVIYDNTLLKLRKSQVPWEGDYDLFLAGRSISLVLYLTNICTHELQDCIIGFLISLPRQISKTKKINLVAQKYQMSSDDLSRLMKKMQYFFFNSFYLPDLAEITRSF